MSPLHLITEQTMDKQWEVNSRRRSYENNQWQAMMTQAFWPYPKNSFQWQGHTVVHRGGAYRQLNAVAKVNTKTCCS